MVRSLMIILMLFDVTVLFSQNARIPGIVIDAATQEEIPYVTISIYNGTELVGGTSTDENGNFHLAGGITFSHFEASFIGYQTLLTQASEIKGQKKLMLSLTAMPSTLQEITIDGKRTNIQLKIDRKIINLGSDVQNSGVNALEAFDQIAEVETDISNGTISLRGSENVRILVNGKPSSQIATEMLQQIPASSIDRVEIISSPSARHQAEGLTGLINIILKKNARAGLNLAGRTTIGAVRRSIGLNGNYSFRSVNFRGDASRTTNSHINEQTIQRQFSSGKAEHIFTPQEFGGRINKLSFGMDFYLKKNHEFSIGMDYTNDSHDYYNESFYSKVTGKNDFTYLRENEHLHKINIVAANYRLKIDSSQHFLEFDYQLNSSKNNYPIRDFIDNTVLFNQLLTEDFVLHSLSVDYTLPVNDKLVVETGISRNTQALESHDLFTTIDSATINNQFKYDESVFGLYGLCKYPIGALEVQMGLRYEFFNSNSNSITSNIKTAQNFKNLFPSVHMSYTINDGNVLNAGYSKRTSRPNFHHTNALQIVNPLFLWEYNPDIIPETSDNIELSYQRISEKFTLGIASFYRHRKNVILWTESAQADRQVFKYENAGVFNSYGLESSFKFDLSTFWKSMITANFYFHKIDQKAAVTWNSIYSSRINIKNTFDFGEYITADLVYLYRPRRQSAFNYVRARNRIDLSINGRFLAKRLSVGIRIVDLFDSNQIFKNSQTANLIQQTSWDIQAQTFNVLLNLSYKIYNSTIQSQHRNRIAKKYNKPLID